MVLRFSHNDCADNLREGLFSSSADEKSIEHPIGPPGKCNARDGSSSLPPGSRILICEVNHCYTTVLYTHGEKPHIIGFPQCRIAYI